MWIRSQDKETLIKIENFYIEDSESVINQTYLVRGYSQERGFITLGKYTIKSRKKDDLSKAKEKALKVIDMLEKHINNCGYFGEETTKADYAGTIITPNYNVFDMPQDEDVK